MKRTLLLFVLVSIFCTYGFAQTQPSGGQYGYTPMTLSRHNNGTLMGQHKSPAPMPSVSYDDNSLYIEAPYEIESATIVIYNEDGDVIYFTETPLSPVGIIIVLPQYVIDERYCLELSYGDVAFIGYF